MGNSIMSFALRNEAAPGEISQMGQNARKQCCCPHQEKDGAVWPSEGGNDGFDRRGSRLFRGKRPILGHEGREVQAGMAHQRCAEPPTRTIDRQHDKDQDEVPIESFPVK